MEPFYLFTQSTKENYRIVLKIGQYHILIVIAFKATGAEKSLLNRVQIRAVENIYEP